NALPTCQQLNSRLEWFMRFTFQGGALCLDFANTIHDSGAQDNEDELRGIDDLLTWAREAGLLSAAVRDRLAAHYHQHDGQAAVALARAVRIRDLVLELF